MIADFLFGVVKFDVTSAVDYAACRPGGSAVADVMYSEA